MRDGWQGGPRSEGESGGGAYRTCFTTMLRRNLDFQEREGVAIEDPPSLELGHSHHSVRDDDRARAKATTR
jgi:hypothetical protein